MISHRSKLSLSQYLELQDPGLLRTLLEKHGLSINSLYQHSCDAPGVMDAIRDSVFSGTHEHLLSLMKEIVKTQGDLRARITPRYRYDERWKDLVSCLLLDGYIIDDQNLIVVDPLVEGVEPLEDDFSAELRSSGLPETEDVLRMMDKSAEDFRKVKPDYNSCLINARVALEILVEAIAKARRSAHPDSFDNTKWGGERSLSTNIRFNYSERRERNNWSLQFCEPRSTQAS